MCGPRSCVQLAGRGDPLLSSGAGPLAWTPCAGGWAENCSGVAMLSSRSGVGGWRRRGSAGGLGPTDTTEAAGANVCVTDPLTSPLVGQDPGPEEYKVSWHFYLVLLHFVSSRSCSWNMLERARVGRRAGQAFTTQAAPCPPAFLGRGAHARGRARRARGDAGTRTQDPHASSACDVRRLR